MKLRKFVSGLMFGLGCALIFIGLLALVLPMIQNDQLRLVLSSFSMPSENWLVSGMNTAMTFALNNSYLVMLIGASLLMVGALLMLWQEKHEAARERVASKPAWPQQRPVPPADYDEWPDLPPRTANPFADYSLGDMLKPREQQQSNPFAAPVRDELEPVPAEARSAYERPADVPKPVVPVIEETQPEETQPIQVPEPLAAPRPAVLPQTPTSAAPPAFEIPRVAGAEAGVRSQSGSRVIVRSTFTPAPQMEAAPESTVEHAEEVLPPMPDMAQAPVSSRIRSTMGKHS